MFRQNVHEYLHYHLYQIPFEEFTYANYKELCYFVIVLVTMYNVGWSGTFCSISATKFENAFQLDLDYVSAPGVTQEFHDFVNGLHVVLLHGKSEKHQMMLAIVTKFAQMGLVKVDAERKICSTHTAENQSRDKTSVPIKELMRSAS